VKTLGEWQSSQPMIDTMYCPRRTKASESSLGVDVQATPRESAPPTSEKLTARETRNLIACIVAPKLPTARWLRNANRPREATLLEGLELARRDRHPDG
jgi:hypothetical protein